VRALLVISVLALLFAPGLTSDVDRSPSTLAAAVLAPTSHDVATSPARPTTPTELAELCALLVVVIALAAPTKRWRRAITPRPADLPGLRSLAFSRRGPPTFAA